MSAFIVSDRGARYDSERAHRAANIALWIIQVLLAALFLFSGTIKLIAPLAELTKQVPMPGAFIRFLGVAELSGAFGLVLPGLLRIRTGLTPLAAGALVIIMSGATAATMAIGQGALALLPGAIGVLAGIVAYGRTRVAPLRGRSAAPRDQLVRRQRTASARAS